MPCPPTDNVGCRRDSARVPHLPPAPTTALLWDLDNVAPPRAHLCSLAEALLAFVEPGDSPRIAAGHRSTFRAAIDLLEPLGVQVLSGGRRRNGADRVLLDQARLLHAQGIERFVVASNDHRFRRIAAFADLDVLTLNNEGVSLRLRAVARSITVLERDAERWFSRSASVIDGTPGGEEPAIA